MSFRQRLLRPAEQVQSQASWQVTRHVAFTDELPVDEQADRRGLTFDPQRMKLRGRGQARHRSPRHRLNTGFFVYLEADLAVAPHLGAWPSVALRRMGNS